ncbi:hypothetical protein GC169_10265 [bacterium]|nr:hypothetical protein [bacterium]
MKLHHLMFALGCAGASAFPSVAQTATDAGARWFHEGVAELTFDHADDGSDVTAATVEVAAGFRLAGGWSVQGSAVLEPVGEGGGDSVFEDEGAYIDSLTLQYASDAFTVYAGKIAPVFGSAADLAPGLYGFEVGEGYQLVEMIGAGADVGVGRLVEGLGGEHVLSVSVFRADRSVLSDSIGTRRGRLSLDDGGLANTSDAESVTVSLDGESEAGWGYTVGYRRLAAGVTEEVAETAFVAGVTRSFQLSETLAAEVLLEAFGASDADGVASADRFGYTLAGTLARGDWRASAILSGVHQDAVLGDRDLDHLELMIGRDFANGVSLDAGVRTGKRDGASETGFGVRLTLGF